MQRVSCVVSQDLKASFLAAWLYFGVCVAPRNLLVHRRPLLVLLATYFRNRKNALAERWSVTTLVFSFDSSALQEFAVMRNKLLAVAIDICRLTIALGIAQVVTLAATFDFVIMNELFHTTTSPKTILIERKWCCAASIGVLATFIVSFWTKHRLSVISYGNPAMRSEKNSILHLCALLGVSALCLYLAIQFGIILRAVEPYTVNAITEAFQSAANWYYVRLAAISVIFQSLAVMFVVLFVLLVNCWRRFKEPLGYSDLKKPEIVHITV